MSDLYDTVKGQQDIFKKLLSYIPGFSGYIERSNRRSADKLLRDQVALKYSELANRASRLQKDLADAGQIDLLDDLDNVSLKLRTFTDRIKNASYGYSGFFDTIKINEKELAQIYAFDVAFFELGDQIGHALGLGQVELAVFESAPRELAWLGQPQTQGAKRIQHACNYRAPAMQMQLSHVLAREARRPRKPKHKPPIQNPAAAGIAQSPEPGHPRRGHLART